RRMQSALAVIPHVYLDTPTKLFMIKRLMQIIDQVQEAGNETSGLTEMHQDLQAQLNNTIQAKDDSVARLTQWTPIDSADTAHEIRSLVKYLHGQTLAAVKLGLIPRAHGSRVVKNLKVMTYRIGLDLNYALAQHALTLNKHRPALGKLRMALSIALKSPIKQYLKPQKETLEKLIKQTESNIEQQRTEKNKTIPNKLASGVDKIKVEDDWEQKRNLYDRE
ncbi:MAG: hypothetical protein RPT25_06345, partial [Cycloclasticus sp.]